MRHTTLALTAVAFFAISPAQAAPKPNLEQIQAAVNTGVAKMPSSLPLAIRVTSLLGCQPSPEVQEEVVCLVGMSAGMRDGYMVLPLRQDGQTWVGVERKNARFPAPSAAEAQTLMRAWAADTMAADPAAAKDEQMQQARMTMQIEAIDHCEVERKTGHLQCDVRLSVPGRAEIKTAFKFALENQGWRFLPPGR